MSVPGEISQSLQLTNVSGAPLDIELSATGDSFVVLPPTRASLAAGASGVFEVRFSPKRMDAASGEITVARTGGDKSLLRVPLSGTGVASEGTPELHVLQALLDLGVVARGDVSTGSLLLENSGRGAALIERASFDTEVMRVVTPLPLLVPPGEKRTVSVRFSPASSGQVQSKLVLEGGGMRPLQILTQGTGVDPTPTAALEPPTELSLPATSRNERDEVTPDSEHSVSFLVGLPGTAAAGDAIVLTARDRLGREVTTRQLWNGHSSPVALSADLSYLASGSLFIEARLVRGTVGALESGTRSIVVTKVTPGLAAPILQPLPALTAQDHLRVGGTAPNGARVTVEGGAAPASQQLEASQSGFIIDVPLQRNAHNVLRVCAERGGLVACAVPLSVVHLVPNEIVVAEASSRRLSTAEVEQLVEAGVITLDDPDNFHVAEFTVVIEVDHQRVPVSQPVVMGSAPGIYQGVPWGTAGGGTSIVVVKPQGDLPPIPGVILIDGKIKSLKELFQVTFALSNLSTSFSLQAGAELRVPTGLTAIRAGLGDDLGDIQVESPVDSVPLMLVPPATAKGASTATAQFVLRGDTAGLHDVRIDFGGTIVGPAQEALAPFEGHASTQISVHGPPTFQVGLTHPDHVSEGERYPLFLTITNASPITAHYSSLAFHVGGGSAFAEEGCPASPSGGRQIALGHLEPGASRSFMFQLVSCLEGKVIGCRTHTSGNVEVAVSTGVACEGGASQVSPSPLPAAPPPIVSRVSPAPHAEVTHSLGSIEAEVVGEVTQVTSDRFSSGALVEAGTFSLERMDQSGQQVLERVLTRVFTSFDSASNRSTLRLSPLNGLLPDSFYRARLTGGGTGVRDAHSGQPLAGDFTWPFRTAPVDDGVAPTLLASVPANGAKDVPAGTALRLSFSERINPSSVRVDLADYTRGSFAVVLGGTVSGGDVRGGSALAGRLTLSADGRTLTCEAEPPIPSGASVVVRVAGITDVFGTPLSGIQLIPFTTGPADTVPPGAPEVESVPRYTAQASVLLTGRTEPYAHVQVSGGSAPATGRAGSQGRFSVQVPLTPNHEHVLSVMAVDLNGNPGAPTVQSTAGVKLVVARDTTLPVVRFLSPAAGSTVRGTLTVSYEGTDAFGPGVDRVVLTTGGRALASSDTARGQLSVNTELLDNGTQTWLLWARDGSGNWNQEPAELQVTIANPLLPRIDALSMSSLVVGEETTLRVEGANVITASSVRLTPAGITVLGTTPRGAALDVRIRIPWDLEPGPATLTVTNAFGESRTDARALPLYVDAPTPILLGATPERLLAGPVSREIVLTGAGFLPTSQVLVDGEPAPTTVTQGSSLRFTLEAARAGTAGHSTVVVRNRDPRVTYRHSGQRDLEVVVPRLGFELPSISLVPGESLETEVTLTESAEAGGYPVGLTLTDPAGILAPVAGMSTIPEGKRRVALSLTGVQTGPEATLSAGTPFAEAASLRVRVVAPPVPVLPDARLWILPRIAETFQLGLDAPAPTAGRSVALAVSNGGAVVPSTVHFPAGSNTQSAVIEGATPGDYALTATSGDGTVDTVQVGVRQAIARSTPEVIRAATQNNQIRVRVATDGVTKLAGVRIEVPIGWSIPEVHAVLGNGTDVTHAVTRGTPGEGPGGGTLVTVVPPTPVSPSDAKPWLDVTFERMMAHEVLGVSTWPVTVDNGAGYVPMLGDGVQVRVHGTAADGAGVVALTTDPSPLVAGTRNASFTLTVDNNVEVMTDPTTIFQQWAQHGQDLNWHLYNHPTHGTILRTSVNGDPGYFTSADALSDGTIELEIGSLTTTDDDFIGLVFRWVDECNFYLLDWKQADQHADGLYGRAGLALRRISNCDFRGDGSGPTGLAELWDNDNDAASPRPNILASDLGPTKGWVANTFYKLKVVLDGPDIDVFIDGLPRLSVKDPGGFTSGRYGPYAYSQAETAIRGLKVSRTATTIDTVTVELPPGWPVPTVGQLSVKVDDVDRSANVLVGAQGPGGGPLLSLTSAGILPGHRYTLEVTGFTAPASGSYPLIVRTAGRQGELQELKTQPHLTVQ
ncbi:Ig-like domain-containing protein [Cystobacter ferrugineus]|uniref:Ig-like domain-containing protein n=1 Tax=Cystobacter ferrugineus TaxID=83449 RepID=UPI000AF1FA6C|nr:Ig-like domain-containing protein [Cystobacter ferrugineus]